MPDVVEYASNERGNDYIAGDIHGTNTAFKKALDALTPGDRLFLVGDLTDRGPDSMAIIDLIMQKNKDAVTPIVYAVKGNHEEMLLDAISYLVDKNENKLWGFLSFIRNGGEWIFQNETDRDSIKAEVIRWTGRNNRLSVKEGIDKIITNPNSYNSAALTRIREFIQPLPYIIRVGAHEDENTFIVCHADMPFSDDVLNDKITKGQGLTKTEMHYITWARKKEIEGQTASRTAQSTVAYVGHNILDTPADAVRANTNTINLDFGAYCEGSLAVVNHTSRTVNRHEERPNTPREAEQFILASGNITAHLNRLTAPLDHVTAPPDHETAPLKPKPPFFGAYTKWLGLLGAFIGTAVGIGLIATGVLAPLGIGV